MVNEIEIVSDGEGAFVAGDRSAVERFLGHVGLSSEVEKLSLSRLAPMLRSTGEVAQKASEISEKSGYYLKLTPEAYKRLKEAGGLMPTKTKGVSHAMLGQTGKKSLKWLQVEDGPSALLTNPAVLSGIGGLMSQLAQQAEAAELKALLLRIDEKLDDVRRAQRDAVIAKMHGAAAAIEEATTIRQHGGDPNTLWAKVSGASQTIHEVQSQALLELAGLASKVEGKTKTGELEKAAREIEREIAVQLAVLGRCFELQDKFKVIELDHVLATAPENLEGHRLGVLESLHQRRGAVLDCTERLMDRMDRAGGIANENILLHARAARSVVDSLNSTADLIDEFHAPLGIDSTREVLHATPWREAWRDPEQLKTAGAEAGQKAVAAGTVVVVVGGAAAKLVAKKK
jgi:hypothetical protein